MKIFTNKKIWQKIVIILLLLIFFQFIVGNPVHAIDGDVLLEPITSLFANLGDGIMEIMQKTIMGMETSGAWVEKTSNLWLKILIIAAAIVVATVAVASIVLSAGVSLTVIATAAGAVIKITGGALIALFAVETLHLGESRILFAGIQIDSAGYFSR